MENADVKQIKKGQGRGQITPLPENSIVKLSKKQIDMIKKTALAIVRCDTQKQACAELGITEQAFYKRLSGYPQIRIEVEKINKFAVEHAKSRILGKSEDGANKLIELMEEAKSENVQLQASVEILDRAGIVKPQSQNNVQVNVLNSIAKDRSEFDL